MKLLSDLQDAYKNLDPKIQEELKSWYKEEEEGLKTNIELDLF